MARTVRIHGIPRQYQEGFVKIRDLSNGEVQELLSAFDEAPLVMNPDVLAERLALNVEWYSREDMSDTLWSLLSVYALREEYELSTSEAVKHIAQAMQDSSSEKLKLTDRDQFEERLIALLSSSRLELAGKASSLMQEHERLMRDVRIITDVRPVFGTELEGKPNGAVVLHTLRLTYSDDSGERREFYVAMDAVDLRKLREALKRAEDKAGSLKSMLRDASVPPIDLE